MAGVLLTLTATRCDHIDDARDLGHVLVKHPDRADLRLETSAGPVHVFYPKAEPEECTVAVLLEVDPVALVRTHQHRSRPGDAGLGHYVNDRPYAASSLLAVALGRVFRTALNRRCATRPELAEASWPLRVRLPAMPCRGGAEMARRVFEPLGWQVEATVLPLDETHPEWGDSPLLDLTLTGRLPVADALSHLYVLIAVLDDTKHYWLAPDEVDKLLRAGEGWLATHPERELITRRYLAHRTGLTRLALDRLAELDDTTTETLNGGTDTEVGEEPERRVNLATHRADAVIEALRAVGAGSVADVGCGSGALLARLLAEPAFTSIIGLDVSAHALTVAGRRLRLDRMSDAQRARITLLQSSLTYRDARLAGLDAIVAMEVIEHIDPPRLSAVEHALLGEARPRVLIVTTPNRDYNVRYDLPPHTLRHRDHRFEWTRAEFEQWAGTVGARYGYRPVLQGIGDADPQLGCPSQMAIFTR